MVTILQPIQELDSEQQVFEGYHIRVISSVEVGERVKSQVFKLLHFRHTREYRAQAATVEFPHAKQEFIFSYSVTNSNVELVMEPEDSDLAAEVRYVEELFEPDNYSVTILGDIADVGFSKHIKDTRDYITIERRWKSFGVCKTLQFHTKFFRIM